MTRAVQKDRERGIVEFYLRIKGVSGKIIGKREPPDILLEMDGRVIGVEVTEYHQLQHTPHGHTRRQVEAAWKKICDYAAEYRSRNSLLDGLSVLLQFRELRVPSGSEVPGFVDALAREIEFVRPRLTDQTSCLRFGASSPSILSKYVVEVQVCVADCYMDLDWNYSTGRVGTSEEELVKIIGPKLDYCPPPRVDESWLLVAGGAEISSTMGFLWAEKLSMYSRLNEKLASGPFDEVAVLGRNYFRWSRLGGWEPLNVPKPA